MISDLDFLETIHVAAPCSASWEEMKGDEQKRFCQHCRKNVYNLSNMTRKQALALVHEKEERDLCVRFYRRADGTVITDNCPVGLRAVRNTLLRRWSCIVSLAAVLFQMPRLVLGDNPPTSSVNKGKQSRTRSKPSAKKPPISNKVVKGTRRPSTMPPKKIPLEAKKDSQPKETSTTEKGTVVLEKGTVIFMGSIGNAF